MNTPVSGAVSDEQIIAAVGLIDFYSKAECLKIGKRVLALTQPAVPVLASEWTLNDARRLYVAKPEHILHDLDFNEFAAVGDYFHKQFAAPQPAPTPSSITLDFKQATALLEMFGGEPTEITLMTGPGHSGEGLYAVYNADPEGAVYLGQTDEDAAPLASEPEPVAAEQARDVKAMQMLWDDQQPEEKAHYRAVAGRAALASQSTPPVAALALSEPREQVQSKPVVGCFAADGKTPIYFFPGHPLMVRMLDFNAALSQSTPPPESAGQGLSDAEIDAVWNACLRLLFSLTDQTGDEATAREPDAFMRGRAFEAKQIAKAMSSIQPEHCDDLHAMLAANRTAQPDGGSKA